MDDAEKMAAELLPCRCGSGEENVVYHHSGCPFTYRPAVAAALREKDAEIERYKRLYGLRGAALRRGCPQCGYVQAAIVAQAEVKK